jgi:nitrate/nitrite-specific signal transduction histidine kinase
MAMSMVTLLVSAMSLERRRVLDALSLSYNTLEERVNERTQQLRDNLKYLEKQ